MMTDKIIMFMKEQANIQPWFYIGAAAVGLVVSLASKRVRLGLLIGYLLIMISITVLGRRCRNYPQNVIPLMTYKNGRPEEILSNILFFIPIGALLANIGWQYLWIGPTFSVGIEILQLLLRRGWFDVDDILNNVIGIAIGAGVVLVIRLVEQKNIQLKQSKTMMREHISPS